MGRVEPPSCGELHDLMRHRSQDTQLSGMCVVELTGDDVGRRRQRNPAFKQVAGHVFVANEARLIEQFAVLQVGLPNFAVPVKVLVWTPPLRSLQRNPTKRRANLI
jgi:hypothetical protein